MNRCRRPRSTAATRAAAVDPTGQDVAQQRPERPELQTPRVLTLRESERAALRRGLLHRTIHRTGRREQGPAQTNCPWLAGKPQKIEIRGHASRQSPPPTASTATPCNSPSPLFSHENISWQQQGIPPHGDAVWPKPASTNPTPCARRRLATRNSRVEVSCLSELAEDLIGTPHKNEPRSRRPLQRPLQPRPAHRPRAARRPARRRETQRLAPHRCCWPTAAGANPACEPPLATRRRRVSRIRRVSERVLAVASVAAAAPNPGVRWFRCAGGDSWLREQPPARPRIWPARSSTAPRLPQSRPRE